MYTYFSYIASCICISFASYTKQSYTVNSDKLILEMYSYIDILPVKQWVRYC